MWIVQALPHLVPFKKWKHEHRSMVVGDGVLLLYEKKVDKGTYRLGRVLAVHPDSHGIVRTVTVGMKKTNKKEKSLPYVPRALEEIKLGVQRIAVICPKEEQVVSDSRTLEEEGNEMITSELNVEEEGNEVTGNEVIGTEVNGNEVNVAEEENEVDDT